MIPLQDTIRARRIPLMNYAIIIANIVLLVTVQRMQPARAEGFLLEHGAVPTRFLMGIGLTQSMTLVSSLFLHGGWLHLLSNMWALFIFGDNIEDRLGSLRYLFFYLLSGVAATLLHIYLNPTSDLPVVGASGAIAGVMGAYLLSYPRARVITLIPLGFAWFVQIPAVIYLGGWFALQLFSGLQTLNGDAAQSSMGGVAWWAHVGGFVVGMLLIKLLPRASSYATWHPDEYRPW
ncbi:MAG: rhomboid family intramembrane serine protease [Anaerolineae bacterium]